MLSRCWWYRTKTEQEGGAILKVKVEISPGSTRPFRLFLVFSSFTPHTVFLPGFAVFLCDESLFRPVSLIYERRIKFYVWILPGAFSTSGDF